MYIYDGDGWAKVALRISCAMLIAGFSTSHCWPEGPPWPSLHCHSIRLSLFQIGFTTFLSGVSSSVATTK